MDTVLRNLRDFFEDRGIVLTKRSASSLLSLLLILLIIPVGIFLLKQTTSFKPKAEGQLIQLGEGGCIKIANNQKFVDCPTVPLKLVNPFFGGTVSSTAPSSVPSVSASPVPSPSSAQWNVNVRAFNNNIQQALDSIKTSGGSVYLPAGTYEIPEKVRVYSNITLFGDGIGSTIIKLSPDASVDDLVANDTSAGQQNIVIRDLTLQGPDIARSGSCCHGLKLENLDGGFVINVEVRDVGMDGIHLGYKNKDGVVKGVSNLRITGCKVARSQRQQIGVTSANNVVIDNCTIDGTNTHGAAVYAGIDLEPDPGTTVKSSFVLSNNIGNSNVGIALNGTKGESHSADTVTDNRVCKNSVNAGVVDISDSGNGNYVIDNTSTKNDLTAGTKTSPASVCDIPSSLANLPAVPAKPTAQKNNSFEFIKTVSAQDSNDVFTDGENPDSSDQFILGSAAPSASSSSGTGRLEYRLAESQAGLSQAEWKLFAFVKTDDKFAQKNIIDLPLAHAADSEDPFVSDTTSGSSSPSPSGSVSADGPQFINTTYTLKDTKPGTKQIWVEFRSPAGATRTDNITFNFNQLTPQILGLSCNLDVSKQNLNIVVNGSRFGSTSGTVSSVTPSAKADVTGWNDTEISAVLKKPSISVEDGQKFVIKIVRADGVESGTATCSVGKSLVSLGARIFCREPGKFDATDVAVDLIYNADEKNNPDKLNKIEEKVTISADGEIENLKTQLQVGKNYAISIKAPASLRRTTVFTALEGTTQITMPDGTPFILPIGDIAPVISPDGVINTVDRAELLRQWRILGTDSATKLTGDFNRDGKVNSVDWACMNYDFGASDDPVPSSIPQPASGTIKIGGSSATITIPGGSASPKPSSSVSASSTPSPSPSNI